MAVDVIDGDLITFVSQESSIQVRDNVEDQSFEIAVSDVSEIQPALTDLFIFPVDNAVTFTTTEIRLEPHFDAYLRDEDGANLGAITTDGHTFADGTYFIEVSGPIKLYIRVSDAKFTVKYPHLESSDAPLNISIDSPSPLTIGARSFHTQPETTITVPDEPVVMMEAVSYLGSSIKEFSCERSWPSIRGHPPLIKQGDSFEVPASLSKPETGITITIPRNNADIYRVAPLAFYFGAKVEPGDQASLRLENGYTEPLRTSNQSLEQSVSQILGTCLLLDSLVRIGGYYTCPRLEYQALAPELPFYPPNLYGESISDQLLEYLEVPFTLIEPYIPEWPLIAVLQPRTSHIELVSHLCNKLALICVEEPTQSSTVPEQIQGPSSVTAYAGTSAPVRSNLLSSDAFDNALSRTLSVLNTMEYTFLTSCDDHQGRMGARNGRAIKSENENITEFINNPSKKQFKKALRNDIDLLYCDLPIINNEFECIDGELDPYEVDSINVRAFIVHEKGKTEVGESLLRQGAIAGICTDKPLSTSVLDNLIYCFQKGFSIAESARLVILAQETPYRIVGDPTHNIIKDLTESIPIRVDVTSISPDKHTVSVYYQPTLPYWLGSVSTIRDESSINSYQLCGNNIEQPYICTTSEIASLIKDNNIVVTLNGDTYHNNTVVSEELIRRSARRTLEN